MEKQSNKFLSFERPVWFDFQNNIFQTGVIKHRNVFVLLMTLFFYPMKNKNFVGIASSFNDRFLFVPNNSAWRKKCNQRTTCRDMTSGCKVFHKIMQDECHL